MFCTYVMYVTASASYKAYINFVQLRAMRFYIGDYPFLRLYTYIKFQHMSQKRLCIPNIFFFSSFFFEF